MLGESPHPERKHARQKTQDLQQQLKSQGLHFRDPPAEPTTCCGRGCNGCVWEGYDSALAWWFEQAQELLSNQKPQGAS